MCRKSGKKLYRIRNETASARKSKEMGKDVKELHLSKKLKLKMLISPSLKTDLDKNLKRICSFGFKIGKKSTSRNQLTATEKQKLKKKLCIGDFICF